jgi:pimeloyl-ACP methyl ester carboxylesterase
MFKGGLIVLLLLAALGLARPSAAEFPGAKTDWFGYDKYDFEVDGRACCVVTPKTPARGNPWIWRARFWGHEPQTDIALLAKGFHVVYIDVAAMFGCPEAVAHWDAFYACLTTEHGFADKAALEGMSRGGLIVYNWAKRNPDKVTCIYADAPVCDIKSWPGGIGSGTGNAGEWPGCLKAYGLTEEEALTFKGNPIDGLDPLAAAKVPLLHVCGGADQGVPVIDNTSILEERYKALGGEITVIIKPGVGHHPHSLKDPKPIVDFVLKHTEHVDPYVTLRGGISNCRARFTNEKKGRVVFMGGSITNMQGWRQMVCDRLQVRFPDTSFDFINAGVPSTDSTLGACRLADDIFGQGDVDLLFVEFAVNERANYRKPIESLRGMEGVIRQARNRDPNLDIVMLHFVDPPKMEVFRKGETPPEIVSHEKVAAHYHVPSIDLAREVTERIDAGEFGWDAFGDLHPAPFGHKLYTASIERLFDTAWTEPVAADASPQPHALPAEPVDPLSYERGRYVALEQAKVEAGWQIVPSWTAQDAGTRPRFSNVPMLIATEPGATLALDFTGTAVGICVVAGPDVGIVEYSIDGGPVAKTDQFTQWSTGLHIPWAYMLATELSNGEHTLTLRTSTEKNESSKGHACRIVKFLAN